MRPWLVVVLLAAGAAGAAAQGLRVTSPLNKHNLSTTGPGPVKSGSVTEICIFCHAPHNVRPATPLWNQQLGSGITYTPYTSATIAAAPGQPTGASKLCLSCHDGTVAIGRTMSRGQLPMLGLDASGRLTGPSALGLNLSDDHPISFVPVPGPQVTVPPVTDAVKLDSTGQLQCTSCHDAHEQNRDPVVGKFLVKDNRASALCMTCHQKIYWASNPSTHRTSTRPYAAAQGAHTGYMTVADNACEACHKSHTASWPARILKAQEALTCGSGSAQCHGGTSVAAKNIYAEFNKLYRHPSYDPASAQTHDPAESPTNTVTPLPERSITATRHAACSDCHNPHASYNLPTTAPKASGRLAGVWGIRSQGTVIQPFGIPPSVNEYEICFKCHADSANKPQVAGADTGFGPLPVRQVNQFNLRLAFDPLGISYHPIVQPGRNTDVPSLIAPWTTSSLVYCTDCHDNDEGPKAPGGSATRPAGPHASRWPHLFVAQYSMTDNQAYSSQRFALCFTCHSESSVLSNTSFEEHRMHIVEERTACFVCHDSHGVNSGVPVTQTKLINFARTGPNGVAIVTPSSSGRLEYVSLGPRTGLCYLRCHGENHDPERYSR